MSKDEHNFFTIRMTRALEDNVFAEGKTIFEMMKIAGKVITEEIIEFCKKESLNSITIFSGYGNNGGDSLVAAKLLLQQGFSCYIVIFGNKDKFDEQGVVPVNSTKKQEFIGDKVQNPYYELIALVSGVAGLFHDFGKANPLFQSKLDKSYKGKIFEPYRHEWLSLRLFQAFVKEKTDKEWLQALVGIDNNTEEWVLSNLIRDGIDEGENKIFEHLDKPEENLKKLLSYRKPKSICFFDLRDHGEKIYQHISLIIKKIISDLQVVQLKTIIKM